ncbi:hypothetical protein I5Q39_02260 [Serratia marcescens]|nr:hypothetical protein [Serratia marcescens]
MITIKRFTPDYKMHAVRFEAFAREAEHGELVRFDAHQQVVSALEAERDALEVRLRNALSSEQKAIQRAHAANQTADALAVENASMREALDSIRIYSSDTLSGPSDSVPDMAAWLRDGVEHLHQVSTIETRATDAALAAIRADAMAEGAEACVRALVTSDDDDFTDAPNICSMVAYQLREDK